LGEDGGLDVHSKLSRIQIEAQVKIQLATSERRQTMMKRNCDDASVFVHFTLANQAIIQYNTKHEARSTKHEA
jgi:hypothetical protein